MTPLALLILLPLAAGLAGCGQEDRDSDSVQTPVDSDSGGSLEHDADGDGYDSEAFGGDDCDDEDPAVHPGGEETWYDGLDSDCDGADDYDQDGDGHASDAHHGDDCDDEDPAVHPGGEETWYDGLDSDCDGADDYDQDGDGWQSEDHGGADCADTDPAMHPGAFDWYDGDDNDCDGNTDFGYLDESHLSLVGEEDGDQAGVSAALVGDIDGDGHGDLALGGHGWPAGGEQGAAWLVSGPLSAGLDLEHADARVSGLNAGDRAGHPVAGAGDVDGDGYDDLLVAAHQESSFALQAGAVYLLRGPLTGELSVGEAEATWQGEAELDLAGAGIDGGADLDGDGSLDLAVGAFDHAGSAGAAYLVPGAELGTASLSEAPVRMVGEEPGDSAGRELAVAGDVNGDGQADLLVGAWGQDELGPESGAAYLFYGPLRSSGSMGLADVKLLGEAAGDKAGFSVASAGDTDGDGYADLLVGAPYSDTRSTDGGAAYLLRGPLTSSLVDLGSAQATFSGDREDILAGYDVHSAGDFDGDGDDDIAVGAPLAGLGVSANGAVYIVLAPMAGSICSCSSDAVLWAVDAAARAGSSLGGGGDIDGDGYDDLLIGAPGVISSDGTTGGAFLVLGAD